MTPDRYTLRSIVNDLIDALINEGVSREDICKMLEYTYDATREYLDIEWLFKDE